MKSFLKVFFLLSYTISMAQQDPQFGQYMMNPSIWNPSYSFVKDQTTLCLHHRTQWVGYAASDNTPSINPPSTQLLTATTPIRKINSGIGLGVMNDRIGPLLNQNAYLSYSYGRDLGSGKISAGIGIGAQIISINTSLWKAEDANDPTLLSAGNLSQTRPIIRTGISYATDNFYVGFSVNNINSPRYNFGSGNISSKLERHYYLQSSYKIYLSDNLSLQPGFLLKRVLNSTSAEFSNLLLFQNFWLGASFRTSDAMILMGGIKLLSDKSLLLGYNIDFSVINTKAKSVSSHEIFLSYNLSTLLDNKKPVIRSPRFRF